MQTTCFFRWPETDNPNLPSFHSHPPPHTTPSPLSAKSNDHEDSHQLSVHGPHWVLCAHQQVHTVRPEVQVSNNISGPEFD